MNDHDIVPMQLSPEQVRARRSRNMAIALALFAMVALFFVMTIVRMGGAALDRS